MTNCVRSSTRSIRLTPTIVEVVVQAPMAARAFQPGQFYRLQNYETLAPAYERTRRWPWKASHSPAHRSIANRGCSRRSCSRWADRRTSARCSSPASRSILMGPTGTPTRNAGEETVLLAGGGLGNAVLFSIGQSLRDERFARGVLRRLQEDHRPLQGRGDREGRRRRHLVLR